MGLRSFDFTYLVCCGILFLVNGLWVGVIVMKNTGYSAWKARLDYMSKEFPFTSGGIVRLVNDLGNLHSDDSPAWRSKTRVIWYKDGKKHGIDADIHGSIFYYYEGIRIPANFHRAVSDPDLLSVGDVLGHPNSECRYVGVKIIGHERIVSSSGSVLLDRCNLSGMELFSVSGIFSGPVLFLKVINSTPESDGSFKNYYLCVPPTMSSCKEAVSWTFGMSSDDYNPVQET